MPEVDDDRDDVSAVALIEQAFALHREELFTEALECLDLALAHLDSEGRLGSELALRGMYLRVAILLKLERFRDTIRASDQLIAYHKANDDDADVGFVIDTLWVKSRALAGSRDRAKERDVMRDLVARYGDHPRARNQVARSLYNEGVYLREDHKVEAAIATWDALFSQFASDPPPSDPFIPVRGQLAKSQCLADSGRLDAALATCESMTAYCKRIELPDRAARLAEIRSAEGGCASRDRRARSPRGRLKTLLKRG
jgi:tetratricopeptide (TPR) repeat protein